MRRTARIAAGTLAIAAIAVAGSQSGAVATIGTDTCTHGVLAPSSGHNHGVEYVSFRNVEDTHIHKYKHKTGFVFDQHTRERNC